METPKTNNVVNFGQDDPETIAHTVGVIKDLEVPTPAPAAPETTDDGRSIVPIMAGVAAVAAVATLAGPALRHDTPAPEPKKTYVQKVEESANKPYDPSKDTIVINGIKIKPGNPDKNTPSEAILSNRKVQEFVDANPNQSAAITTSAMTGSGSEFAVVERDVDGDGDMDAIAVATK